MESNSFEEYTINDVKKKRAADAGHLFRRTSLEIRC